MESKTVEVNGIIPAVEFLPNGDTTWKKQHSTPIIVKETGEKIKSIKYKWTTRGVPEPQISEFTKTCPNDNIITGRDDAMTGTYYLWILLTTENETTHAYSSKGFNFNNEAPKITSFGFYGKGNSQKIYIETTTKVKSQIIGSVYINGEKYDVQGESGERIYLGNINTSLAHHEIKVSVTDENGNGPSKKRFIVDNFVGINGSEGLDCTNNK